MPTIAIFNYQVICALRNVPDLDGQDDSGQQNNKKTLYNRQNHAYIKYIMVEHSVDTSL